jgi:hypothetical protein
MTVVDSETCDHKYRTGSDHCIICDYYRWTKEVRASVASAPPLLADQRHRIALLFGDTDWMAIGRKVELSKVINQNAQPSQRNNEAWLDRLRTTGFWLVEDHVFGRHDRVRSELMGARREGTHA